MTLQLNPDRADGYDVKTLAQMRQIVFDELGFIDPLQSTFYTQDSLADMRKAIIVRLGLAVALLAGTDTYANIATDVYNALGYAAQTVHPPGIDSLISTWINTAQKTLATRIELDRGAVAQPATFSGSTQSTIDAVPIRLLAIAYGKAHYGKADAQAYGEEVETYLKNYTQRTPPNIIARVNAAIIEAHNTVFRRYEVAGLTTAQFSGGPASEPTFCLRLVATGDYSRTICDNELTQVDSHPVQLLALARLKEQIGQADAKGLRDDYERYMADQLKRTPANAVRKVNANLKLVQESLWLRYEMFRMERWYTWDMMAGQRFYGAFDDNGAQSLAPTGLQAALGSAVTMHNMTVAREQAAYALLSNGKVLITGGFGPGFSLLTSSELYDESTGVFTSTGAATESIFSGTMVALPGGKVFAADSSFFTKRTSVYTETTGTWAAGPDMTIGRSTPSATLLLDGTVLIVGGEIAVDTTTAVAEIYDPGAGTITAVGSLAGKRNGHTATLMADGRVLIAGGVTDGGTALKSAEVYNPATKAFTSVGNMSVERFQFTATALTNGSILLVGGFQPTAQSSAELFDPASNTFSLTGSLPAARGGHQAVLLRDDTVLVFGGNLGGTYYTSTAIYDQGAGTFSAGPVAPHAQDYGVAIRLASGKVLGAGGYFDNTQAPQNIAMLYDPDSGLINATGSLTQGDDYYKVTALTANGESLPSLEVLIQGVPSATSVVLSWTPMPNQPFVTMFGIYRGKSSGGEELIATVPVTQTTYTDEGTIPAAGDLPTVNTTPGPGHLDPRYVRWVGISQNNNVWRELTKGIVPEHFRDQSAYSGVPSRYEIRQGIEVWPPPKDDLWQLRIKGYFPPGVFESDDDVTSIDWQAIALQSIADCKVFYKQPDAALYAKKAADYIGDRVGGTHMTARYVPGARYRANAVPPLMKP